MRADKLRDDARGSVDSSLVRWVSSQRSQAEILTRRKFNLIEGLLKGFFKYYLRFIKKEYLMTTIAVLRSDCL